MIASAKVGSPPFSVTQLRIRNGSALRLAGRLQSREVAVTLVKAGDHRLSSGADLARLAATLDELLGQ